MRRNGVFGRKELASIEREMRDAERVGRSSRVVLVLRGATSPVAARIVFFRVVPEMQGYANHVMPSVDEARCSDARVDAAGHGHHDSFARNHALA
jgi:hypothetical protein